ncbi:hypothetical protein SRABI27_02261 [Pedobacter sp. Bi27]|nr:hypothetical protein SRABI27_02261 [Pedobacter sp. Bi27]CAH0235640.1 hypothetical protein SRABI36_02834 [Pedobacter sp. Bi36]CAH0262243.1 hypothetical protein SRABI126_03234 [Pedobacter sp. Bi126]
MGKKSLVPQQLNSKLLSFATLSRVAIPTSGWIKAILNMNRILQK